MRALAYLRKTFLENLREWKILSLALVFAPAFVYMMYGYYGAEAEALLRAWREAKHPDGQAVFTVIEATGVEAARAQVKARDADLLVEIPAGFSGALQQYASGAPAPPARLENHADKRNQRASMAMAMSDYVAFAHVVARTGARLPLDVAVSSLGAGRPITDFDLYVPALLALVALALAYLAAMSCGYRSEGSLVAILVVGAAATLGVVAFAVLCSAFLKSMFELLTVGTFPFFVLLFFSECMFPLPKIRVLEIGGHALYANDILPTTLCVRAFQKILNFGAGLGDVAFELGGILVLAAGYFAVGTWLFSRRHQRV